MDNRDGWSGEREIVSQEDPCCQRDLMKTHTYIYIYIYIYIYKREGERERARVQGVCVCAHVCMLAKPSARTQVDTRSIFSGG